MKCPRILVGCEFSGIVRDAFLARGFDAVSCDLLDSESIGPHIKGDVTQYLSDGWDLGIFHPPCRFVASSGARWFKDRRLEQREAIAFAYHLLEENPIERIALENPIGVLSTEIRKPDQIVQPWQFGHGETKATCLWLKNLPKLIPTRIVGGREMRVWKERPGPDRWKRRSRTYLGIANAMVEQWGPLLSPLTLIYPEG